MRVIVFTGSRGWRDERIVFDTLSTLRQPFLGIVGDAQGFDSIVWRTLGRLQLPRLCFRARWREHDFYNKAAGHDRNRLMLVWGVRLDPEGCFVIAGWDGQSPGTKGMIDTAQSIGLDVWKLAYNGKGV